MPRAEKGVAPLVAAVLIIIACLGVAGGILVYQRTAAPQYTSVGIPLYPGASEITATPENVPIGVSAEAYQTSASEVKVIPWLEEKMTQQGWSKRKSQQGEITLSWWEREGKGVTLLVGPAEEMGRIFGIRASGTVFLFLSGNWTTVSGLETRNIAPPSVQTLSPTGVEATYATLNAKIDYGGYPSVEVRFRYREVGGSWKYTSWETWNRSSYDYRVSDLEPGESYEFEAEIRYENRTDGGGILEFETEAEAPAPEVIFGGQLSLENVEGGRTVIVIKHVYGERADEVIETDSFGVPRWKNLELRVNGVIVSLSQAASMVSEGQLVTWGPNRTYSMVVGDLIRVPLASPLEIGDIVSLKWVPKNQLLVEMEVMYEAEIPSFVGAFSLENVEGGRTIIVVEHVYGERAPDVVEKRGGVFYWKNLELRVNGVLIPARIVRLISEGRDVTYWGDGYYSLVAGDLMRVQLDSPLNIGDVVSLKWVPTNQLLVVKEATYMSFPTLSMYAFINGSGDVILSLGEPSEGIGGGEWSYRAKTAEGTILGSWTVGWEDLRAGTSVTLEALWDYVSDGRLGTGDYVQITHLPSGHVYEVPISYSEYVPIFGGQLSLENVENGMTVIFIKHTYGDRADNVLEVYGGTPRWKNLELRINGVIVQPRPTDTMVSMGTLVTLNTDGVYSIVVGDRIRVTLDSPLKIGDVLSLKWVPANQLLMEREVLY